MFGEKHRAITKWLTEEWWSEGPPVCVISGFPGTGKTNIAVETMNAVKQARPTLPIAFFNCLESKSGQIDDFLLTMTEELAADGDREPLERLEKGEDVPAIFNRILAAPRLIVGDEAQRLLVGSTGAMPNATALLLEKWSRTVGARGRLLLLASREFDLARWGEQVDFRRIGPLEIDEAEAFLRASLEETRRTEAVPLDRITDVVIWLGCNPRAIKLLVSALTRESLDDLIGVAAESWEARDRNVSPELLLKFEEEILKRAEEGLGLEARIFLSRLSVMRQPIEGRALQALRPEGNEVGPLRDDLIARYMLELRRNRYEMNSVLRDTVRIRMTVAERRRAHLAAGRYYAAPFRARRTLGTAEKLGARFIEARYHFTLAESEADLDDISQRFEAHYRTQFGLTTPVPFDPQERDERITLLSGLLQARGAKGLEYHLARLLVARDRPGDVERALPHARRATGPQSPADAWVLRIRLEARIFGAAKAAQVALEGAAFVDPEQGLSALYQAAGEILARDGKPDEAVELLGRGIANVNTQQGQSELYQAAGEILARSGKPDEAIDLLSRGIANVDTQQGRSELYGVAAEILAQNGKSDEAVKLLRQAVDNVKTEHGRSELYRLAGEILVRAGKHDEAAELLSQAVQAVGHRSPLLYVRLSESLVWAGRPDEAIGSLLEGFTRVSALPGRYRLSDHLILLALTENRSDILPIASFEPREADVFGIASALAQDDPERAAWLGTDALSRAGTYISPFVLTAFAFLSVGEPAKAEGTLRKFARPITDAMGYAITWLRAFIALERGAIDEARGLLDVYLGAPLDAEQTVDRALVLRLWDTSPNFGLGKVAFHNVAFQFPWLSARLTGLTRTVVRHQYGGPVLTEEDLRVVGASQLEEPAQHAAIPLSFFDSARVLIAMRPDRWNGLYVLGCYDRIKTVYVQQCRALTLIHALFDAGEIQQGSRLGVIGGGAAGVTAAAAAARKGAKVILFERAEHLLPLQRQNTKRYLHPHLFDWPATGSTEPQAGLPLLNWGADWAGAVAAEIARGFDEVIQVSGNIELRLGTGIQDVEQIPSADQTRRVQILGAEGEINEIVDVAIIAVGFGIERMNLLGVESPPYWEDDGLEQALGASPESPQRILISGAGDGALIDLLRATIRDFRNDHVIGLLPEGDDLRKLQNELQVIEDKAKRNSLFRDLHFLNMQQMYGELVLMPVFLDQMRKRIRAETKVWFNFTAAGRYSLNSSILNRFLVSVVSRLGGIQPKLARLDEKTVTLRPDGKYAVTWPRSTEPQIFDRVVVRHGPPSDYVGEVFPKLEVSCAPLRGKLRDLDLTGSLDDVTRAYFAA